ncbi:MFS transporter [Corynebacterium marinum DSM 44953]|uniref:MFS transporter n=1 Tax=Corynebacterium marinum DSM 44953 TaxID=1224162 RepID=A0A0B6TCM0_9CORY|nr:MFS transporter [Corynebacterium marinum DSM 44953]GGO12849.1 MFS transporter [Corynebacterium marinum]
MTVDDDSRQERTPKVDSTARERLISPTFVLAWVVNFLQYLLFYLLVTTIALYAVREFAASQTASGLAASSFVIGATLGRIFCGYVIDTLGKRPVLLVSAVVIALTSTLYLVVDSLPLLIAVRIVHGCAYAFASTALMAIAQTAIPSRRRAEGTGYFALTSTLATAVGPALGLALVGAFTYDILFIASLAIAVLALALSIFLRPSAAQRQAIAEAKKATRPRFSFRDIAHPAVAPIGAFMLLIGLAYGGVITFLNGYAVERGVLTGAGLFFLAYAVPMLLMRPVLGRLQDKRGDNIVVYLGLALFILALGMLALATADWHVVLAGALTGLGYGTLMPACQAIAVNAVPREKIGTGISTLFLFMDLGLGLGPILLGALVAATGYGTMYATLAGVAAAAAVLYFAVHGRRA